MTTQHQADLFRNAKLLLAAVQLRQTHGLLYAMRFLEERDFSAEVVWEVLNLIPHTLSADYEIAEHHASAIGRKNR